MIQLEVYEELCCKEREDAKEDDKDDTRDETWSRVVRSALNVNI